MKLLNAGFSILICCIILVFLESIQAYGLAADYDRVTVNELSDLLAKKANVVVVDVRSKDSYDAGHIPGAISMSLPDGINARHGELPQDKTIILYCSWLTEGHSVSSAQILENSFGFKHDLLKVLKGGLPAWEQAGYPIEIGTPASVKPMGKRLTLWSYIKRADN